MKVRHEGAQRSNARLRQVLEVDHDAAVPRSVECNIDLVHQRGAAGGAFHDGGCACAIPLGVGGVLQHRHHQRAVHGGCQDAAHRRVIGHHQIAVMAEREQRRRDPVELADMAAQRFGAAVRPRGVEADVERLAGATRRRGGMAAEQLCKALRNTADLRLQRERGLSLEAQRQRRRGGNRHHGRREDQRGHEQHDKPDERAAAGQAAAAAGGIEEDRTRHGSVPQGLRRRR